MERKAEAPQGVENNGGTCSGGCNAGRPACSPQKSKAKAMNWKGNSSLDVGETCSGECNAGKPACSPQKSKAKAMNWKGSSSLNSGETCSGECNAGKPACSPQIVARHKL